MGFNYESHQCCSAKCNMLSAIQNPEVVEEYRTRECERGRVLGPVEKGSLSLQINRFGVFPKPHQPGKWRLIVDLSQPKNTNVNDGIEPTLCHTRCSGYDNQKREGGAVSQGGLGECLQNGANPP